MTENTEQKPVMSTDPGADPGFAKGGSERGARAYNWGLGSEPLPGSRGPRGGGKRGEAPLKPKAFCPFS